MWDIVFKDHNERKAPRNAEGSDFLEVLHPDIGNVAKKISQTFLEKSQTFFESQGRC